MVHIWTVISEKHENAKHVSSYSPGHGEERTLKAIAATAEAAAKAAPPDIVVDMSGSEAVDCVVQHRKRAKLCYGRVRVLSQRACEVRLSVAPLWSRSYVFVRVAGECARTCVCMASILVCARAPTHARTFSKLFCLPCKVIAAIGKGLGSDEPLPIGRGQAELLLSVRDCEGGRRSLGENLWEGVFEETSGRMHLRRDG